MTEPATTPAERQAVIDRLHAKAMAATDAAIAGGMGLLHIRSLGLAAGIPDGVIAKSQEMFLAMNKEHEVPGVAQLSQETIERVQRGTDSFYVGPLPRKDVLVDDAITGNPTLLLPLPVTAASLQIYVDGIEAAAKLMGLTDGKAVVLESKNPGHILLRWESA